MPSMSRDGLRRFRAGARAGRPVCALRNLARFRPRRVWWCRPQCLPTSSGNSAAVSNVASRLSFRRCKLLAGWALLPDQQLLQGARHLSRLQSRRMAGTARQQADPGGDCSRPADLNVADNRAVWLRVARMSPPGRPQPIASVLVRPAPDGQRCCPNFPEAAVADRPNPACPSAVFIRPSCKVPVIGDVPPAVNGPGRC